MPSLPNREAVIRLVGASAMGLGPMAASWRTARENDEWAASRRYMPGEKLSALCKDDPQAAAIVAQ